MLGRQILRENLLMEIPFVEGFAVVRSLGAAPGVAFLDSAKRDSELGRWSFVAYDPIGRFDVRGGQATWNGGALSGDPLGHLEGLLVAQKTVPVADGPPFQSGAVGWIAYEAASLCEPAVVHASGRPRQVGLWVYDSVLAIDHNEARAWLSLSPRHDESDFEAHCRLAARARAIAAMVATATYPGTPPPLLPLSAWRSNFRRDNYEAAVARVIEYIRSGDIFQANIAQRFAAHFSGRLDPLAVYQRLHTLNPATFAALLCEPDGSYVASSSPERLVELRGDGVSARPIKGTRRRSAHPGEDAAIAAELEACEKDRAENIMIVDLLRNDLSRVCAPGSVQVDKLCGLESYSSVHHLVSAISGRLEAGGEAIALLGATFPGGSITGAPKIRAMEIIREIEGVDRGNYCGAIGYFDFGGDLDLNISIRTVEVGHGVASFGAGGGITLLSDPAAEYDESLAKAERIFEAFSGAGTWRDCC